jgi:hypothetical protein
MKEDEMMGQKIISFVNSNGSQALRSRNDDLKMKVKTIHQGRSEEDAPRTDRIHDQHFFRKESLKAHKGNVRGNM